MTGTFNAYKLNPPALQQDGAPGHMLQPPWSLASPAGHVLRRDSISEGMVDKRRAGGQAL